MNVSWLMAGTLRMRDQRGVPYGQGVATKDSGDACRGVGRCVGGNGLDWERYECGERYEGNWRDGTIHGGVHTVPDGRRATCILGEPCPVAP